MKPIVTSLERDANLEFSLGEVIVLLSAYDAEVKDLQGRSRTELAVFKRAGIILAVTAWESYIEDVLCAAFAGRLREATKPSDIEATFNMVANAWLDSQSRKPRPHDLARWAGESWKTLIQEKFDEETRTLNTPNSANIKKLSKRYLGLDLTERWKWKGVSSAKACTRLDKLIQLRGRLVHRAAEFFEKDQVSRAEVVRSIELMSRLAWCTELALNHPEPTRLVSFIRAAS